MKSFFDEFKKFALRGNALDLAVGIMIGGAFGAITNSLVQDILTPPLGLLLGDINFADWAIPLRGHVAIHYGLFVQAIITFTITALALFLIIKGINQITRVARREEREQSQSQDAKSAELVVLEEIRDSLKAQNHG